jgi:hypothetical protein
VGAQKKKDRSEYFKSYYEEKKEHLAELKRRRYQDDPEYREAVKSRARERRQKQKDEREKLIAEGKIPAANLKRGPRKPVKVMVRGDLYDAYSVTTVAKRINRSVGTIYYWINTNIMPDTPIRRGGERLYTTAMILVLKLAIARRGKIQREDKGFRQEILDGWQDCGVYSSSIQVLKR